MDIALKQSTVTQQEATITVSNIGGFAIPFDIIMEYTDGTNDTIHKTAGVWQANQQQATVAITAKKKIQFIELNTGIFMDAYQSDNSWGKRKETAKATALGTFNAAAITEEDLEQYLGNYTSTALPIKINIMKEGKQLIAEAMGQGKITMTPVDHHTFENSEAGVVLKFDPAAKAFNLLQAGGTYLYKKQ